MAKKENKDTTDKVKVTGAKKKAAASPPKSGEVKGPKGTGEKKTVSEDTKKASKTAIKPTAKANAAKGTTKRKLPKPKKDFPEENSASEKKTTAKKSSKGTTEAKKAAKPKATTTAKSAAKKTGVAKKVTQKNSEEKKVDPSKTGKSVTSDKKKTTEKTTEDFTSTAKGLADKVIPDEETRKALGDTAKAILPDQKTVKKTVKKTVNKAVDTLLPDDEEGAEKKKTTAKKGSARKSPAKKAAKKSEVAEGASLLSEYDVHLFREGKHYHLYKKFGSHLMEHEGTQGVYFAVWAPNAEKVSVIGDFNGWDRQTNPMKARNDESGIWEAFIPEAKNGSMYKYYIRSHNNGYEAEKGDPFAFKWETPPNTASVVWDLEGTWNDGHWMKKRKKEAQKAKPYSVYELHVGSWKRKPEEDNRSLTYRELAEDLPAYLNEMGFTHVEFMPVMEHPFFGSWGYQVTGYFAPSSRFGSPQDFMHLIDALHQAEIGVILDWVPSHFPSDLHGLHYFDGTFLYEHADPRKGFHPDWQSYIFNYGRNEVRSFLISNSVFWLDKFHVDGLRVDAVASMLYLDYSRKEGEWEPNENGGNENLEAISFLKEFNETVYGEFPDIVTIAEESTAWPMVSKPTYMGGLGFGQKWMMGWMHDTLEYFQEDPIHRKYHQNTITFSTTYAFTENFMLPLSHDEVVYGKQAILNKMPGDEWNKFANLRSLYAYMYAHPGTKLLFMGAEFGQRTEWDHDSSLDWHETNNAPNRQIQETLKALNRLYKQEPALYEKSFESEGFEWIDINDHENSIISFLRKGEKEKDAIMVVCNLTPVPRENYRIGVPDKGTWAEIFNSDAEEFGGSNVSNTEPVGTKPLPTHGKDNSIALTIPPMGVVYLKKQ
ncbi:1,4-alpha-glucan branching protein GlgB [Autumnicola edwardsiae]|uniref:1,4-alpha-glucan branching enzyme GlgB n=1 Tax=Autumnicola edwardsiae TaxID=3075594 RepID=A0ABU3CX42_9FLAO|nr:1,4-alpha-glucan branching protein GlgB [Zunongwangia sp. F297]MDT0650943.1 1,4-alpha-glucan branching protein GlgB [Zunongwangia sp. F297]